MEELKEELGALPEHVLNAERNMYLGVEAT